MDRVDLLAIQYEQNFVWFFGAMNESRLIHTQKFPLVGAGRETITAFRKKYTKPITYTMRRKFSIEIFKEVLLTVGTAEMVSAHFMTLPYSGNGKKNHKFSYDYWCDEEYQKFRHFLNLFLLH